MNIVLLASISRKDAETGKFEARNPKRETIQTVQSPVFRLEFGLIFQVISNLKLFRISLFEFGV